MMSSIKHSNRHRGFTLIELLVAIAVIGILVGMLSVAVSQVLVRTRTFSIQNEMNQLESAIEQFRTQYGFYPPSFRGMEDAEFREGGGNAGIQAAGDVMLTYLNRISPNHVEGVVIPPALSPRFTGERFVDRWWADVGGKRRSLGGGVGSDLAFWLSGLAKNKQRPLTQVGPAGLVSNAAHNKIPGGDGVERVNFYEFKDAQVQLLGAGEWIQYNQPAGVEIPYLYLDHDHYLPTEQYLADPSNLPYDGAYCNGGLLTEDYDTYAELLGEEAQIRQSFVGSRLFNLLFPNSDSFQLITFGLDGMPGVTDAPNAFVNAGVSGADNMVNFGNSGPIKLEALILETQVQ